MSYKVNIKVEILYICEYTSVTNIRFCEFLYGIVSINCLTWNVLCIMAYDNNIIPIKGFPEKLRTATTTIFTKFPVFKRYTYEFVARFLLNAILQITSSKRV